MATITTSSYIKNNTLLTCSLELSVSQGTQSVVDNKTTINYSYKVTFVSSYYFSGTTRTTPGYIKITINGTQVKYVAVPLNNGVTNGTIICSGSGATDVVHNDDGTKSCSYKVEMVTGNDPNQYNYVWSANSSSSTLNLTSIPRASTISSSNVNLGSATRINVTRAVSTYTDVLTYKFGNATGGIHPELSATYYDWTPPLSLASEIPNSVSGTCTITCTTYSGSTKIGSNTCTITLSVPSSVKPTITSLTATRVDGDVPSDWNEYIQTKSKVTLKINGAAGSYGSKISSYSITGGGFSSTESSFTTGFLSTSGNITFTAKVTDSRGRVSSNATVSIDVLPYSAPLISSSSTQRCTSDGTLNDEGTYGKGNVKFTYSKCNDKNTLTKTTYYKKSSSSTWTNANTVFYNGSSFVFGGGNILTDYTYDIKYVIKDAFSTVSIIDFLSTAKVLMDFKAGGTSIAIGKVSESNDTLELADTWKFKAYGKELPTYVSDKIKSEVFNLVYPVGSIYMSVNSTNPGTIFGGTWSQLQNRFLLGAGSSYTAGNTGGASTVALTVKQMPKHKHSFNSWQDGYPTAHTGDTMYRTPLYDFNRGTTEADIKEKTQSCEAGGGEAHNNMPPYLVVYMWKRIA